MNTILITGATGFVGSNLVKRLTGEGYRIIALCRKKEGWDRILNETRGEGIESLTPAQPRSNREHLEDVELIQGDITLPLLGLSGRRFRRLAWQVDTIFHSAAQTDFTNSNYLFRTNVEGTRHLLQFALLGRKKHFHHISSAYVAGNFNGTFYEEDFNKKQSFNNSYEESKFSSEALVRRFARQHTLPFTVYRPSVIVGDSETGRTQCYKGLYAFARAFYLIRELNSKRINGRVCQREPDRFADVKLPILHRHVGAGITPAPTVSLHLRTVSVKIPMRIFGDPEALINLVPVDYVVEAIKELSQKPEAHGKTFHLTNPRPITLSQIIDKLTRALRIEGVETQCQASTDLGVSSLEGYVSSESLANRKLNPAERFFLHYTKPYLPYLRSRLCFDDTNTRYALNGDVACPEITQSLVSSLIDRALEDRWGARHEAGIPATTTGNSTLYVSH
ncbi:MAG TPA: SDR family oxidoreductase [Candidatus Hypogeohydataceae bacterium YC41]